MSKLRKLLTEVKKKVGGERRGLGEVHVMCKQASSRVLYALLLLQTSHQAVMDSIAQDNIRDNVESLTRRLQVEMLAHLHGGENITTFFNCCAGG